MEVKETSWASLNRHDRACARLARIARNDTMFGGARAMVLARHAEALGVTFPASDIVSDVYGRSDGTCGEYGAYACPECGQAYLGRDAAYACCQSENF